MLLKLFKRTNINLLLFLVITLFIFVQNVNVFNTLSRTSDKQDNMNSLPEDIMLEEGSSLKNSIKDQQGIKEEKTTFILKLASSNQKNSFLNFIHENKIELVNYLENLDLFILKSTNSELNIINSKFELKVSNNKQWQGIPTVEENLLQKFQQNSGYENPRVTINAENLAQTGTNVKIAIIDTGIDKTHQDFENFLDRIVYQDSFVLDKYGYSENEADVNDLNGHGTHVAGIAAGSGSKNPSFTGIAPKAKLIILKVGNYRGFITTSALLAAIDTAIERNADIINLSLGFSSNDPDDIVSQAVDRAVAKGISVVISAGNSGSNNGTITSPASSRLSISVGAYDTENSKIADFSSRGLSGDGRIDPDIVAPGVGIIAPLAKDSVTDYAVKYYSPSPIIDSNYIGFSGTSMAAPVVAGAIALLLEEFPNLNPMTIRTVLMNSSKDLGFAENIQGAGLLDIHKAIQYLNSNPEKLELWNYLPKKGILENSEIPNIIFQNEKYELKVFFTSNESLPISLEVPNSTLANLISIEEQKVFQSNFTFGSYKEITIVINPKIDTTAGLYKGNINILINNVFQRSIPLGNIIVLRPKTSMYWSVYHSDESDNPKENFQKLDKILRENSIYAKVFDKNLQYLNLKLFDFVVLVEPEIALFSEEISDLVQYIREGGNVIIFSSYFPFTNIYNLNSLTNQFGIELLNNIYWNVTYNDVYQTLLSPAPVPLDLNISNPILSSVSDLTWYDGTVLTLNNNNIITLANVKINETNFPVSSYFNGNSSFGGKLFVSGESLNFKNPSLNALGNDSTFFLNLIKNFETEQEKLKISTNTSEIFKNSTEKFSIRLFENTKESTLNGSSILNATLIGPVNSSVLLNYNLTAEEFIFEKKFEEIGLYNLSFQHGLTKKSIPLKVYGTKAIFDISIENENQAVNVNSYPSYINKESPIFITKHGLSVNYIINSTSESPNEPKISISSAPKIFYEISGAITNSDIVNFDLLTFQRNGNLRIFNFVIPESLPVGIYFIHVYQQINDYEIIIGNTSSLFIVIDENPKINLTQSTIKGNQPFSNFENQGSNTNYLTVLPGEKISFDMYFTGSENSSSFRAVFVYAPYWIFVDSGFIVDTDYILSNENNHITGSYTIPENRTIKQGDFTINLDQNNILILFVVLMDDFGNSDEFQFIILLQQENPFTIDTILIFIGVILFPMIFLFIMMYRSSQKRKDNDMEFRLRQEQRMKDVHRGFSSRHTRSGSQFDQQFIPSQPIEEQKFTPQFCGNCGSPLSPGETFCMECGKKLE